MFFFFNDTATTEIYTLSLHDALPIWPTRTMANGRVSRTTKCAPAGRRNIGSGSRRRTSPPSDRKSTRLNSSHSQISYAVFCLKKKNEISERVTETVRKLQTSPRAHIV